MYNIHKKQKEEDKEKKMSKNKDGKGILHGKKGVIAGVAAAVVIVCAAGAGNSTYTINEQEQAVVTTFGVSHAVTDPGLHFKIPFIQQVTKVNTTIQSLRIGYDEDNEVLEKESVMITSDFNFVDVDFYLEYRVADPVKAVYASKEPELILRNVAQSCIRAAISNYDVDSVLTTGKGEIQSKIKEMISQQLETYNIGLQLVNISIQDSEPPTTEVMEAFKAVETAKQGKETSINNANKYRNEKLPIAEADADQILQEAQATKQERINEANAQVAMFNAKFEEYEKNPDITKKRMFYEAMEEIMPDLRVIIDGTDSTTTMLHEQLNSVNGQAQSSVSQSAATQGNTTQE